MLSQKYPGVQMATKTPEPPKVIPNFVKFVFGGLSGVGATCFVHPLDLAKNRMQTAVTKEHKTSFHLLRQIIQTDGPKGLYTGVTAGWMRQATYTTFRLGIYTYLFEKASGPKGQPPGFFKKAGIGMVAGVFGAFVGTPSELCLIRMTADGRLPPSERRNYRHILDAFVRVSREEGITTLWRGAVATMGRAMVVNAAQLASYSQSKQLLLTTPYFSDNIVVHFVASMISGFVTTVASMPVDIAKTRIQYMKFIDGKPEYKGAIDVLVKVVRNEGFFSLYKGFTPYYMRVGPTTVLTFIFFEQLNKLYRRYILGDTSGKGGGL